MTRYLRAANVQDGMLDLTDVKEMNFEPRERQLFALRRGDVLVTEGSGSLRAVGASAVWNGELAGAVCFQNTLLRLRPRSSMDGSFLGWWCRHAFASGLFASVATGANIFHLSTERVRSLEMRHLPLQQQKAIAAFLEIETARLNVIIAKKQRLIELLTIRFTLHVRSRVASSGRLLPMKRSWHVVDCKHRTPKYVDDGYPVVSPGDVTPGRLDLNRAHRFVGQCDFDDLADAARRPRRGDIVYSRNASIGVAAYVDTDTPFCMGQDVCLITSRDQDQLYLTYALNTLGVEQLQEQKIGSTFSRVNVAQIVELLIPTPPAPVQRALAKELDAANARHEAVTARLRQQIALLQEHRQALITAAVTGELEIPGAA
jgi:type I restriction enzyme S subunit